MKFSLALKTPKETKVMVVEKPYTLEECRERAKALLDRMIPQAARHLWDVTVEKHKETGGT